MENHIFLTLGLYETSMAIVTAIVENIDGFISQQPSSDQTCGPVAASYSQNFEGKIDNLDRINATENVGLKLNDCKTTSKRSDGSNEKQIVLSPVASENLPLPESKRVLIKKNALTDFDTKYLTVRTHGQKGMSKESLDAVIASSNYEIDQEEKNEADFDIWGDALDPIQLKDSLPINGLLYSENHSHFLSATLGHLVFAFVAYGISGYIFDLVFTTCKIKKDSGNCEKEWKSVFYAGFIVLRLVRRQRRVWLRSSYGTLEYNSDIFRRKLELEVADRHTILGRIRSKVTAHRRRRHSNNICRATRRIQKKNSRIKSISNDQAYITPITNIPYAHGGYFGAAPYMLADPLWVDVLRQLMPDVYCEVSKRIFVATPRLIHWAENNPVVAAYGLSNEKKTRGRIVTLEWDVFLDPHLVECVENALNELDSMGPESSKDKVFVIEGRLKLLSMRLLEKMLIAHGSTSQLMMEQLGFAKKYNFSRVKRTRRTLGGGIFVEQWLSIFAEALKLGSDADVHGIELPANKSEPIHHEAQKNIRDMTDYPFNANGPDSSKIRGSGDPVKDSQCVASVGASKPRKAKKSNTGFCSYSILEAVRVITEILHGSPGVVLDLKSRNVSKRVWARLINTLRDCGVRVEGAGSFYMEDIRGLSDITFDPVPEMNFFHSAGDLQYACNKGLIQKNDTVYFNAGSLLLQKTIVRSMFSSASQFGLNISTNLQYALHPCAFFKKCKDKPNAKQWHKFLHQHGCSWSIDKSCSTIEDYQEVYQLNIGVYSQEFAIDEVAADLLCRFVNEHSDVFNLGFSWGGVNGVTVKGIQPGLFTSTDGLWNQRYVGKSWNSNLVPGDA